MTDTVYVLDPEKFLNALGGAVSSAIVPQSIADHLCDLYVVWSAIPPPGCFCIGGTGGYVMMEYEAGALQRAGVLSSTETP